LGSETTTDFKADLEGTAFLLNTLVNSGLIVAYEVIPIPIAAELFF
jgi:hypothetical protein